MARVTNTKEHINKIKKVHGNKFELVEGQVYITAKTKLKYRCLVNPDHGIFEMRPDNIQQGQGCQECGRITRLLKPAKRRKTIEAHKRKIKKVHGNKLIFVEGQELKGIHNLHFYKCLVNPDHGEKGIFNSRPSGIERGSGCPDCGTESSSQKQKLGLKVIKSRLKNILGIDFEIIGLTENTGVTDTLLIKCLKNLNHGTWPSKLDYIFSGRGCPKCANESRGLKRRIPLEKHLSKIKEIHGDKLEYVKGQPYKGISKKHEYRCLFNTGHDTWVAVSFSVHNGTGCPDCSGTKKLTLEIHRDRVNKIHEGRIQLIEGQKYTNWRTKMQYQCLVHPDHGVWETSPGIIQRGGGCPKCAGVFPKNTEEHKKDIFKAHGGNLELVEEQKYINSKTKLKYKCLKDLFHGEWLAVPTNITRKKNPSGCPKCGIIKNMVGRLERFINVDNH